MPQTYPKITVLIPTFNRAEYLAECLDSIITQTLPPHQIIVVNDGSTDQTVKVIENYLKSIEYFETNQFGKPCAINHGLERTLGEYLWIFDTACYN
ncbi:MAG: glycosyltransferase family 2 protein [Candidatus Omnitrophota bacterium]|nr:MAG: glycosyltransferase family 2 protein [Candidatus Omnitrophota bacterium]